MEERSDTYLTHICTLLMKVTVLAESSGFIHSFYTLYATWQNADMSQEGFAPFSPFIRGSVNK